MLGTPVHPFDRESSPREGAGNKTEQVHPERKISTNLGGKKGNTGPGIPGVPNLNQILTGDQDAPSCDRIVIRLIWLHQPICSTSHTVNHRNVARCYHHLNKQVIRTDFRLDPFPSPRLEILGKVPWRSPRGSPSIAAGTEVTTSDLLQTHAPLDSHVNETSTNRSWLGAQTTERHIEGETRANQQEEMQWPHAEGAEQGASELIDSAPCSSTWEGQRPARTQ